MTSHFDSTIMIAVFVSLPLFIDSSVSVSAEVVPGDGQPGDGKAEDGAASSIDASNGATVGGSRR